MKTKPATASPTWGDRTIEVKVRFWTNNIARGKGKVVPKFCWEHGSIQVITNPSHGIEPQWITHFHGYHDLASTIEAALKAAGIKQLSLKRESAAKQLKRARR